MSENIFTQLEELDRQRTEAEAKLAELRREAVAELQRFIDSFELTAADFRFKESTSAQTPRAKAGSTAKPKYRDPATGRTWTGRGREPVWMREAIEAGKTREDFRIPEEA